MRPFEEKIVTEFKGTAEKAGMGKAIARTRPWVIGHLTDVGEDYPYNMFRRYREFCVEHGLPISTYPSFRLLIYKMSREGIIKRGRTEPGERFQDRHYWKLS